MPLFPNDKKKIEDRFIKRIISSIEIDLKDQTRIKLSLCKLIDFLIVAQTILNFFMVIEEAKKENIESNQECTKNYLYFLEKMKRSCQKQKIFGIVTLIDSNVAPLDFFIKIAGNITLIIELLQSIMSDDTKQNINIKNLFPTSIEFQKRLQGLFILYLYPEIVIAECKTKTDVIELQTYIREYFFNYIDPLDFVKLKNLRLRNLSFSPEITFRQNTPLVKLPPDILLKIYENLDNKDFLALPQTCKSFYFFQRSMEQNLYKIYFTIGTPVCITKSTPKKKESITVVRSIDNNPGDVIIYNDNGTSQPVFLHNPSAFEVSKSFDDNKLTFDILSSPYQAIEFAYSKSGVKNDRGYIPTVIAVMYLGDPSKLQYHFMTVSDANNAVQQIRSNKEKETYVSYATVSKEQVLPLIAYALLPTSMFAEYQICQVADYKNHRASNSEAEQGLQHCLVS